MIPRNNIHLFFKDGEYFCSVKLPTGSKPTIWMSMGYDNRNFADIVVPEIQMAYAMLREELNLPTWKIVKELPGLLGWKECWPDFSPMYG